jgi:hypothetical protein
MELQDHAATAATITVALFCRDVLSARAPLALLVAIFYLLGMATGSSLFALLRRSIARSRFNAMTKS